MQQEEDRSVLRTGFAIEDFKSIDGNCAVVDSNHMANPSKLFYWLARQ